MITLIPKPSVPDKDSIFDHFTNWVTGHPIPSAAIVLLIAGSVLYKKNKALCLLLIGAGVGAMILAAVNRH